MAERSGVYQQDKDSFRNFGRQIQVFSSPDQLADNLANMSTVSCTWNFESREQSLSNLE